MPDRRRPSCSGAHLRSRALVPWRTLVERCYLHLLERHAPPEARVATEERG